MARRPTTFNSGSAYTKARLQAALYYSRKNRLERLNASSGGGGGGGAPSDAEFGLLTLAGAGGIAVPVGATSITGGTATGYTVTSGLIVPTSNGSATAGTLEFDVGGPVTVSVAANTYSVRTSVELVAAMDAADLTGTRAFVHRDTALGDPLAGVVDLTGYVVSGRWTIIAETPQGAYVPGVDLSNSTNITFSGFRAQRYWNGEAIGTEEMCIEVTGSDGLIIENCEMDGDPLTTYGGFVLAPTKGIMHGVGCPASVGCTNLIVRDNYIHNVKRPFRALNSTGVELSNNRFFRCYQSYWEIQGDNFLADGNFGYGLWAHGGGIGQTGPNNPTGSPTLYPYDWADSHSGLYGTGVAGVNHVIRNNLLNAGEDRFDTLGDYHSSASGGKYNDAVSDTAYQDIDIYNNVFMSTDNTGQQLATTLGGRFVNNTVACVPTATLDTLPNINTFKMFDFEVSHNVACAFVTLTGSPESLDFDQDFLDKSWNNVIARADGQGGLTPTVAGDPMCYDQLFAGPFVRLDTPEKMIAAFTPLPGTRLNSGPRIIGGVGYHNWSTGITTSFPSTPKPKTTVPTGVTLDRVDFTAATYTRSLAMPDMTADRTAFTVIMALAPDPAGDNLDMYLAQDSSNAFVIRRKPIAASPDYNAGGRVSFYLENTSNGANISIDSSLPVLGADGFKVIVLSVDVSSYTVQLLIGPNLDPFPRVVNFRGQDIGTNATRHDLMPGVAAGSVERFLMIPSFIDLTDQTQLNALVALDGRAPSYGADGSAAVGAVPPVYLAGDAVAWNNVGGLNLGSDATKYVVQGGSVTDTVLSAPVNTVAPAVTPSAGVIVGQVLTVAPGTWTGNPVPQLAYQWQRGGVDIAGATSLTYTTVDPDDVSENITCLETATNSVSVVSQASNTVVPASAGGNIAPDPGFDNPSAWTDTDGAGTVIQITGGQAVFTSSPAFWRLDMAALFRANPVTPGVTYDMSIDVVSASAGARLRILMQGYNGAASISTGSFVINNVAITGGTTLTASFVAPATATHLRWYVETTAAGMSMTLDNLVITPQ